MIRHSTKTQIRISFRSASTRNPISINTNIRVYFHYPSWAGKRFFSGWLRFASSWPWAPADAVGPPFALLECLRIWLCGWALEYHPIYCLPGLPPPHLPKRFGMAHPFPYINKTKDINLNIRPRYADIFLCGANVNLLFTLKQWQIYRKFQLSHTHPSPLTTSAPIHPRGTETMAESISLSWGGSRGTGCSDIFCRSHEWVTRTG